MIRTTQPLKTFAGLTLVSVLAVVVPYACTNTSPHPAPHTPTPVVAVATPRVIATWATFSTGADQPHRTTADGLEITDVENGSGAVVRSGDGLTVRYIMWLGDGRQADSSDSDGAPFKFTLGTGMVIKGLDEGVPGMAVGGTRRLVIPPELAYGAAGVIDPSSGGYVVPPSTKLVFVIQLLSDGGPG